MLGILKFENIKGPGYKVRITPQHFFEKDCYIISAKPPKSELQKRKLKKVLRKFNKKLLVPKEAEKFYREFLYPKEEFENALLKALFLDYCKRKKPTLVNIVKGEGLEEDYYLALGKYVGRIVEVSSKTDLDLAEKLLNSSGTVISFLENATDTAPMLNLTSHPFKGAFDTRFLRETEFNFSVLKGESKNYDPIRLSAAFYREMEDKSLLKICSEEVMKRIE